MSNSIYSICAKLDAMFSIEPSNIPNQYFIDRPDDLGKSISSTMLGHKHSEESKRMMSASHKGMKKPWAGIRKEESKRKLSNTLTGKKRLNVKWDTLKLTGNDRTEKQKLASKHHSERMTGRKAHNRKHVTFRNINFESVKEAISFFNISATTYYKELNV